MRRLILALAVLLLSVSVGDPARAQIPPPECFDVVHAVVEDVDVDGGGAAVYKKVWDFERFEGRDRAERHARRIAVEGVWDHFGQTFYPPNRIVRIRFGRDCI